MTERKRERLRLLVRERERIAAAGDQMEPARIRIDRELCLLGAKFPPGRGMPDGAKNR